jgi:hypothetical protein
MKNYNLAPLEVKQLLISSYASGVSYERYCRVVVKYPEWFTEEELKQAKKYNKTDK